MDVVRTHTRLAIWWHADFFQWPLEVLQRNRDPMGLKSIFPKDGNTKIK